MKRSEVFREARNVLMERGWYQGDLENEQGAVCVNGACNVAQFDTARVVTTSCGDDLNFQFDPALTEALGSLDPSAALNKRRAWIWNDCGASSIDQVLELLERAEKLAEQDES